MNNDLYDALKETIEYIRNYYLDWQDYIERFSFPRMDYYYLIVNISSFYWIIDLAFYRLEEWKNDQSLINLFYVLICIPKKIVFTDRIYNNFKIIRDSLDYNFYVLEKYKENQETN